MKILVTGSAGFIGMHTCLSLLDKGHEVLGVDNLNDYYDVRLKRDRLQQLRYRSAFAFREIDIADRAAIEAAFGDFQPRRVIHLAAQAGVRHSITHPHVYAESNLTGFLNMLECCRQSATEHLVYASSSSVYGGNQKLPFSEHDSVDHPISLYAATKRANELMAHSYSHLFRIPTTGLRFFTVYGPWGRPDMALFKFAHALFSGEEIEVYNNGQMVRDFTYIDDIVEALVRIMQQPATSDSHWNGLAPDPSRSNAPYRIFNIGNSKPVQLMEYIEALEQAAGRVIRKKFLPIQAGDVVATAADTSELDAWIGFKPTTSVLEGVRRFVGWYRNYYGIAAEGGPIVGTL
jgi:UDP-glucuronate 4-epimerase